MTLRPSTVTVASRIMLPTYIVSSAWLGLAYLLGGDGRTSQPNFDLAHATPGGIRVWGVVFLSIALVLAVAVSLGSRSVVGSTLIYAACCHFAWGLSFAASTFVTTASWAVLHIWGASIVYPQIAEDASLVGPMWPWFAAFACIASAASLSRDEVS